VRRTHSKPVYESLFRVWGKAWGMMWKTYRSPSFTTSVNPWGATKHNKLFIINGLDGLVWDSHRAKGSICSSRLSRPSAHKRLSCARPHR